MKAVKSVVFIIFILLFFSSCYNFSVVVNECENIEDEQTRELLHKYFDEKERAYILTHFKNYNARYLLGETYTDRYNVSYIKLYDDAIEYYSDFIGYPFEFVRGDIIIHELCHVLFPHKNHSDKWLNTYKQKLEKYCMESKDYLMEYYCSTSCGAYIDTLIENYIYIAISDYE